MIKESSVTNEKEVIEQMLVENTNDLTRSEISEKLLSRQNMTNQLDNKQVLALGGLQKRIRQIKLIIAQLREMLATAKSESPLADISEKEQNTK